MNIFFRILILLSLLMVARSAAGQETLSRSGYPAPLETRQSLRFFPCGGVTLFEENFRADSLPAGWLSIKLDTGTVHPNLAVDFEPGWQSIQDFKNPNSRSVASPSWYSEDSVRSDNWLITPRITLGDNTCFSWFAYSQDRFFEESYEVRISLTTPTTDSAGFLATAPLLEVANEGASLNYRSLNLRAYAGKEVYLAFRQTSLDRFMLVLDDVRLAEIALKDIGVYAVEEFFLPSGDSTLLSASLRNYGSDTLSLDSTIVVAYTINGTDTVRARLLDDTTFVNLAPNDTFRFTHPVQWKPADTGAFWICMWSEWDLDEQVENDTACARVGVGLDITAVGKDRFSLPVKLFPNPTNGVLNLSWEPQPVHMEVRLYDAFGRQVHPFQSLPPGASGASLDLQDLPQGIYYIQVLDGRGGRFHSSVLKK